AAWKYLGQVFPFAIEPAKALEVLGRRQAAPQQLLLIGLHQLDQVETRAEQPRRALQHDEDFEQERHAGRQADAVTANELDKLGEGLAQVKAVERLAGVVGEIVGHVGAP